MGGGGAWANLGRKKTYHHDRSIWEGWLGWLLLVLLQVIWRQQSAVMRAVQ